MENNSVAPEKVKKYYKGLEVVTIKDIEAIHNLKDAVQTFRRCRKFMTEGEHYFLLTISEYLELYEVGAKRRGNPNLPIFLFTKKGYKLVLDSVRDKDGWAAEQLEALEEGVLVETTTEVAVTTATAEVQVPTNQFDLLRSFVDALESNEKRITENENRVESVELELVKAKETIENQQETIEKVMGLIEQGTVPTSEVGAFDPRIRVRSARSIAKELNLRSTSKMPHSSLINKVAEKIGLHMYSPNNPYYKNAYTHVIKTISEEDLSVHPVKYYTEEGERRIKEWLAINSDSVYFKILYKNKRGEGPNRVGLVQKHGYELDDVRYYLLVDEEVQKIQRKELANTAE